MNGIDPRYAPIHVSPAASRSASKRAAAVQAAYAILILLLSGTIGHAESTAVGIADGISIAIGTPRALNRFKRGSSAARRLPMRSGLGAAMMGAQTPPPFTGGTAPGEWRPTPPASAPVYSATRASDSMGHAVTITVSAFSPPALTDIQYRRISTKSNSWEARPVRTGQADETEYALFWNPGNPPDFWIPLPLPLQKTTISTCCKPRTC